MAFAAGLGLKWAGNYMGWRYRVAPSSSFSLFFRNDILENISQSSSSLKHTALRAKVIDTHLGSWGKESPLEKGVPPHPTAT